MKILLILHIKAVVGLFSLYFMCWRWSGFDANSIRFESPLNLSKESGLNTSVTIQISLTHSKPTSQITKPCERSKTIQQL